MVAVVDAIYYMKKFVFKNMSTQTFSACFETHLMRGKTVWAIPSNYHPTTISFAMDPSEHVSKACASSISSSRTHFSRLSHLFQRNGIEIEKFSSESDSSVCKASSCEETFHTNLSFIPENTVIINLWALRSVTRISLI